MYFTTEVTMKSVYKFREIGENNIRKNKKKLRRFDRLVRRRDKELFLYAVVFSDIRCNKK